MVLDTRFASLITLILCGLIIGCGGGGGDTGVTPPTNHAPIVDITSGPPAFINPEDTAAFAWQGSDQDDNLSHYFAGLDGSFIQTLNASVSFTNFIPGSSHIFGVFAVDSAGLHSDTADWSFSVNDIPAELTLLIFGQGAVDDDGDGFWTQFQVNWSPRITTAFPEELRLWIALQPTFGSAAEIADSTDLITRNPGQEDTLTFSLPAVTKNYYNLRAELHNASGAVMVNIPYDSISSMTQIGLEDLEGFHAWFDDAWTANAIDELPTGSPDGYFESIDIWWDADAYPDDGRVKVVVFQRDSTGFEENFFESQLYDVSGFGNEDAFGVHIEAGTTFGNYDYRLRLFDQFNILLDELTYGEEADLVDIPLGNSNGIQQNNQALPVAN